MYHRKLNAKADALHAAVPNMSEVLSYLRNNDKPFKMIIDVKVMFFNIPIAESDKAKFAFTFEGKQYTFSRLPQGYIHSSTLAHNVLSDFLKSWVEKAK